MIRMCSITVASRYGGPFSASAEPRITPMISATASCGRLGESVVPALDQLSAQRGEQRILHAVVMPLRDTVFAVVAAQLGEERHRLLGPLGDRARRTTTSSPWRTRRAAPSISGGNRSRTDMSMANQRV